jgi:LPS-assembly lipoprotein
MWSFKRRQVLALPLALAACGFEPVYGPGSAASTLENRLLTSEPRTRDAYLLNQRIEERFGRATDPAYRLSVILDVTEDGLAINTDGDIERYNVIGKAKFRLQDMATDAEIISGEASNFTGYSATGSTVTTLAAQRDARKRLMTILADQITIRLQALPDLK